VINRNEEFVVEDRGFSTEDVIWAIGIWSVILCLSPVIVFYMLMVAEIFFAHRARLKNARSPRVLWH